MAAFDEVPQIAIDVADVMIRILTNVYRKINRKDNVIRLNYGNRHIVMTPPVSIEDIDPYNIWKPYLDLAMLSTWRMETWSPDNDSDEDSDMEDVPCDCDNCWCKMDHYRSSREIGEIYYYDKLNLVVCESSFNDKSVQTLVSTDLDGHDRRAVYLRSIQNYLVTRFTNWLKSMGVDKEW